MGLAACSRACFGMPLIVRPALGFIGVLAVLKPRCGHQQRCPIATILARQKKTDGRRVRPLRGVPTRRPRRSTVNVPLSATFTTVPGRPQRDRSYVSVAGRERRFFLDQGMPLVDSPLAAISVPASPFWRRPEAPIMLLPVGVLRGDLVGCLLPCGLSV